MKKLSFLGVVINLFIITGNAQTNSAAFETNKAFTGAKAPRKTVHAIYPLDSNDPKVIEKTFRHISNALTDIRLVGKVEIEVIGFGSGTEVYLKGSKYEDDLKVLLEKGVIISQCNNSLLERKISRDQIYDFVAVVPSANGELIIRQAEGWAVIKQ
ncbi:MAG: DsrE family protein [Pedobacter sp.]|nr:DsrE family protein [Chitinophagaceae bacterium]